MKTERKPYLVKLKPNCADAYAGKLQVGREYQALFSLENAKYMSIVGTDDHARAQGALRYTAGRRRARPGRSGLGGTAATRPIQTPT